LFVLFLVCLFISPHWFLCICCCCCCYFVLLVLLLWVSQY
jgi:hypothetical protein